MKPKVNMFLDWKIERQCVPREVNLFINLLETHQTLNVSYITSKDQTYTMWAWVRGVYVNSSVTDEGALSNRSPLHIEDRFIAIGHR